MSKLTVTEHRHSIAPPSFGGSTVQPYDPALDRPETVTEGAHLIQYYSDAWQKLLEATELYQAQVEQEFDRLQTEKEEQINQEKKHTEELSAEIEPLKAKLVSTQKRLRETLEIIDRHQSRVATWLFGIAVSFFVGWFVGTHIPV